MGGSTYSSVNYVHNTERFIGKSVQEVFTQRGCHSSMSPINLSIREARDSEIHPNTVPIIIGLDVTGSMGYIPEHIIKGSLGTIVETIMAAGISDPAIMFIAIGDHISDDAPLQVGQFESGDKELVMWLERTWLEGHGGGTAEESYLLAWYLANKHVVTDAWEKRNKKGILITIGDEKTHTNLSENQQKEIFGTPQADSLSHSEMLLETQKKWNVYHIHANDGSYPTTYPYGQAIVDQWKKILGQNVFVVEDHKNIATKIADIVIGCVKEQNLRGNKISTPDDYPTSEEML